MRLRWNAREHLFLVRYFVKWVVIACPVAAVVGSAVALFLWLLDWATRTRWDHPWLLFLLPVAGVGVGALYHLFGKSVESGNNLIVEQIHKPGGGVPARMAPLVLIGTVITHLFGGSAGREGTAVQMGGSIASLVCRKLKLPVPDVRTLLMTGIAAGFGAVFGTPLTGAIFAIEVLSIGRMSYESLLPCLIGGIIGDWATNAWGIGHTYYHVKMFAELGLPNLIPPISWLLLLKVAVAAVAFGLTSVLFTELTHGAARLFKSMISSALFRPAVGGLFVILLVYLLGTRDYLGIGVTTDPHTPNGVSIVSCFELNGATPFSWWWKIVLRRSRLAADSRVAK